MYNVLKYKFLCSAIDIMESFRQLPFVKSYYAQYIICLYVGVPNYLINISNLSRVTADQVAHQLLINGKGNSTHRPSKVKITGNYITEHSLTSPFTMEELMKGIKILKYNKFAGLGDMLCEQIKHLGHKVMVWLKTNDEQHPCVIEVSKAVAQVQSDCYSKTGQSLIHI